MKTRPALARRRIRRCWVNGEYHYQLPTKNISVYSVIMLALYGRWLIMPRRILVWRRRYGAYGIVVTSSCYGTLPLRRTSCYHAVIRMLPAWHIAALRYVTMLRPLRYIPSVMSVKHGFIVAGYGTL